MPNFSMFKCFWGGSCLFALYAYAKWALKMAFSKCCNFTNLTGIQFVVLGEVSVPSVLSILIKIQCGQRGGQLIFFVNPQLGKQSCTTSQLQDLIKLPNYVMLDWHQWNINCSCIFPLATHLWLCLLKMEKILLALQYRLMTVLF